MNLLQPTSSLFFILLTFFFVVPGFAVSAESTINCHCFKDRTFNPADPWAADDYILATCFNSFLSRSFAVPKREIVMLKMKEGVGQDDLLIGLQISRITGTDLQQLLGQRRQGIGWSAIVAAMLLNDTLKNNRFLDTILTGIPDVEAGAMVADTRIGEFFGVEDDTIQQLRKNGLNEKEITLVLILAHVENQKPAMLVDQHDKENRSWSAIATGFGIEPAAAGKLILQYPAKQLPE